MTESERLGTLPVQRGKRIWIPWTIAGVCAVVAVIALVFALLPKPANGLACSEYAAGYNGFVAAIKRSNDGQGTASAARGELYGLPQAFERAESDATGRVKSSIEASRADVTSYAAAEVNGGDTTDIGTAFALTTQDVQSACKADGSSIVYGPLK